MLLQEMCESLLSCCSAQRLHQLQPYILLYCLPYLLHPGIHTFANPGLLRLPCLASLGLKSSPAAALGAPGEGGAHAAAYTEKLDRIAGRPTCRLIPPAARCLAALPACCGDSSQQLLLADGGVATGDAGTDVDRTPAPAAMLPAAATMPATPCSPCLCMGGLMGTAAVAIVAVGAVSPLKLLPRGIGTLPNGWRALGVLLAAVAGVGRGRPLYALQIS